MIRVRAAGAGARTGRALWLGLLAVVLAWAPPLEAQEPPRDPVPDSTEDRIRERLRRLARPIGYDSVLYVEDSLRVAAAEGGVRPRMAASGDSVLAALAAMPGYSLTRYEGAEADFAAGERILVLQAPPDGRARVSREGIQVEADSSITFDETSGRMRTAGMATFTPLTGEPINSQNMIYDLNEARGSATSARTEFSEGGTRWFMTGDMPYAAQDSTFLSHARFTTCDLEEPHYHFETDEIKVVGGRLLVARGVRLYFADVPVAWLPFMAQSLEQGRASGLLTPRFSVNDIVRTSSGYQRRLSNLGFYWAMSDYTDAVVAFDWFSDAFVSLETGFQYRVNRQFLDGTANVRTFWRDEGGRAFSLDTNHNWEPDERTRIGISGRYATETSLVTDYSLDPREATRSIESNGGLDRRFDWGSLSLSARRAEYLSDDRVEWDLPKVNLSFSSRTLFPAPTATANAFNNMTWSGRTSFARTTMDRAEQETFSRSLADTERRTASAGTRLGVGNLSISPAVSFSETATLDVPESLVGGGVPPPPGELLPPAPVRDVARAEVSMSASVSYQQQLIGSTTLTPDLTVRRDMLRDDESELARSFVAGPTRLSLSARLKTDIYGFFPGFGSFEAIRHKLSPSISYQWTPEARPDELQRAVFGSTRLQARNVVSVGLNQTFEARRRTDDDEPPARAVPLVVPDSLAAADSAAITDLTPQVPDTAASGPRRLERAPVVQILGLNTQVVTYDFVEADSLGSFLGGFQTVSLSNQISSDYLRGLSISVVHDLFKDTTVDGSFQREFAPRLSSLNFGFSLSSRSSIVRWLGLGGGGGEEDPLDEATQEELDELEDPFLDDPLLGEQSMIPGRRSGTMDPTETRPRSDSEIGSWNARVGYSLQRPRARPEMLHQMLTGSLTLRPTQNWDLSWRTSYDMEAQAFNDHVIRLTRDLHEWEAHFDFMQTATGNWSFRFEVALTGLRDLKFDYRQRNLDVGRPAGTP